MSNDPDLLHLILAARSRANRRYRLAAKPVAPPVTEDISYEGASLVAAKPIAPPVTEDISYEAASMFAPVASATESTK